MSLSAGGRGEKGIRTAAVVDVPTQVAPYSVSDPVGPGPRGAGALRGRQRLRARGLGAGAGRSRL